MQRVNILSNPAVVNAATRLPKEIGLQIIPTIFSVMQTLKRDGSVGPGELF